MTVEVDSLAGAFNKAKKKILERSGDLSGDLGQGKFSVETGSGLVMGYYYAVDDKHYTISITRVPSLTTLNYVLTRIKQYFEDPETQENS